MLALGLLLTIGIAVLITRVLSRFKIKPQNNKTRILLLGFSFLLVIAGGIVIVIKSNDVTKIYQNKNWPTTIGRITSSKVVGDRAFHPEIFYEYRVNGKTFTARSFLNMPGFGGRTNRRDAAEKLVKKHHSGLEIQVHYNPDNPSRSSLKMSPTYADFLQLSFGVTLYIAGLFIFSGVVQRSTKKL